MSDYHKIAETEDGVPICVRDKWEYRNTTTKTGRIHGESFYDLGLVVMEDRHLVCATSFKWLIRPLTMHGVELDHDKYAYKYPGVEVPEGVVWPELWNDGQWEYQKDGWSGPDMHRCKLTDFCEECNQPHAHCPCPRPCIVSDPAPAPTPLVIEAGKCYRTRDGRKARVLCTDRKVMGKLTVVALVDFGSYEEVQHIRSNGRYQGAEAESDIDLIAPWVDAPVVDWAAMPAWANWVAQNKESGWFGYPNDPKICEDADMWLMSGSQVGCFHIPESHAPSFSGNWRDSLVQRPEVEG